MALARKIFIFLLSIVIIIPSITFAEDEMGSIEATNNIISEVNFGEFCLPVDKMAVELGSPGKWFTPGRDQDLRYIVIHSTESPYEEGYADKVADWLSRTEYKASTHFIVGPDKILQTVDLYDTAWGVGSEANSYSIQIEVLGYAKYNRDEWLTPIGTAMLCKVSYLIAILAKQYNIPIRKIESEGIIDNLPGVAGHYVFSETLGGSDHWDPGHDFPWDVVLAQASKYFDEVYYKLSEDAIKPDVPIGFVNNEFLDFNYTGSLPEIPIFDPIN